MKTLTPSAFLVLLAAVTASAEVPPSLRESPQAYFSELVHRGKTIRTEGHKKVAQEVFAHLLQNLNAEADGAEGDLLQISEFIGNVTLSEIGPLQEILDPNVPRSQKMYFTTANLRGVRAPSLTIPVNIFIPLMEDEIGMWKSIQAVESSTYGFTNPEDFSKVHQTLRNLEVVKNLFSSGESLQPTFRSGAFFVTLKTLTGTDTMKLRIALPRFFGKRGMPLFGENRAVTLPEALAIIQKEQTSPSTTCKSSKNLEFPLYAIPKRPVAEPHSTIENPRGYLAIDASAEVIVFDQRWASYLIRSPEVMEITSCADLAEKLFNVKSDLPAFVRSAFRSAPKPSLQVGHDEY